ncbi:MAG: phosphatase PAP2 family protein [Thermoanaerobaculia bacterium]
MSIDGELTRVGRRRYIAVMAFVSLLLLSIYWPSPVVSTNLLCCNAPLAVDDLSFLGREAPSWDLAFWWIGGLLLLAILQSGLWSGDDFIAPFRRLRRMRFALKPRYAIIAIAAALLVAVIWRFADAPITAWAEAVQSDEVEAWIRIVNRLGGGMNPALIVIFFFVAGVVYRHARWVRYALAMAIAGAASGILGQIVKFAVGRTRPELWLGPFHHARAAATSFPSGHTVGAFALGGVLLFASRSLPLRVTAVLLAFAVGLARVLAFRHWTSDVTASACVGLIVAAIVTAAIPAEETT